jgi:hypothetical protein
MFNQNFCLALAAADPECLAQEAKRPIWGVFLWRCHVNRASVFSIPGLLVALRPPWMSWHSEAMVFSRFYFRAGRSGPDFFAPPARGQVTLPYFGAPLYRNSAYRPLPARAIGLITFWGDVWVIWFT